MKLSITSQINTTSGLAVTGAIGNLNANTDKLLTTGTVSCMLQFYASDNAKAKGMSPIIPVTLKQDGTIDKFINSCVITLTENEVTGANLPNTIYTKVAEKLHTDYGWTVAVV